MDRGSFNKQAGTDIDEPELVKAEQFFSQPRPGLRMQFRINSILRTETDGLISNKGCANMARLEVLFFDVLGTVVGRSRTTRT